MVTLEEQIQQASTRNTELLRILAETDYAPAAFREQTRFVNELGTQIKSNDSKLEALERQRVVELADHEKFRDSHFRRFMFKATGQKEKFATMAAKEEKEFYDVLKQQHETTVLNNKLRQQLEDAQIARAELEAVDELHRSSQLELDNLYNSIFAGETPSFPEEDQLERESDLALQHYHDTRVKHEEQTRAASLLRAGLKNIGESSRHMEQARGASRMDLFGFDGLADAMERSSLAKAEAAYREARSAAERAQLHDLPTVNINHGHIMRDVFFDNIFTDMAFHEEIKRAESEVKKFKSAIMRGIHSLERKQNAVAVELREAEKDLENTRNKLQEERQRVFERLAREHDTESIAEASSGSLIA